MVSSSETLVKIESTKVNLNLKHVCLQLGKSLIFNKPLSKETDGAAIDSPLGPNLANALVAMKMCD